ncbi:hypothetical protein SUGI_1023530 [Cryptomeria japonica]|nr:hypothetical protein SUGI_1023530 [Cryptomeria japonica]
MGRCNGPHSVLFPFPAQGQRKPMMQLANNLVEQGFIISFFNTTYNYSCIALVNKHIACNDFVSGEGYIGYMYV